MMKHCGIELEWIWPSFGIGFLMLQDQDDDEDGLWLLFGFISVIIFWEPKDTKGV